MMLNLEAFWADLAANMVAFGLVTAVTWYITRKHYRRRRK